MITGFAFHAPQDTRVAHLLAIKKVVVHLAFACCETIAAIVSPESPSLRGIDVIHLGNGFLPGDPAVGQFNERGLAIILPLLEAGRLARLLTDAFSPIFASFTSLALMC